MHSTNRIILWIVVPVQLLLLRTIIPSIDVAVVVATPRVISERLLLLEAMFDDDGKKGKKSIDTKYAKLITIIQ